MKWRLNHSDVSVDPQTSKAQSRASITIEHEGVEMTIYSSEIVEDHIISTRKALVDSGYLLRNVANELLKKADKIHG